MWLCQRVIPLASIDFMLWLLLQNCRALRDSSKTDHQWLQLTLFGEDSTVPTTIDFLRNSSW